MQKHLTGGDRSPPYAPPKQYIEVRVKAYP